jgi:hypothetical protein
VRSLADNVFASGFVQCMTQSGENQGSIRGVSDTAPLTLCVLRIAFGLQFAAFRDMIVLVALRHWQPSTDTVGLK